MVLQSCKEALIANEIMRHSELDVRVSAASCTSQIIRITAPDEPFKEEQVKGFFLPANIAFKMLSCMSGRAYLKALSILHTMSNTQSCVMMLDHEIYAPIGHMFHLFLDGIRTSHLCEVFASMEKFTKVIVCNTVDNDEFLSLLVKIFLNSLTRQNQKVSSVSFQLADNTFKNCSGDLETYLSEVIACLDVLIENYADAVLSFLQDATETKNTDSKDAEDDVSCPGESGLAIEADLMLDNETQNCMNDENRNENRGMISHSFDGADKLDKSMHMEQEQKPEELHIQRKRNRRSISLKKVEEGYDPFCMLIDWKSLENPSKKIMKANPKCPKKPEISSPMPCKRKKDSERNGGMLDNKPLKPNNEGKIVGPEDRTRDIIAKNHSKKGQGSKTNVVLAEEGRKETTIVSEEEKEDIMTSSSQCPTYMFKR